MDNIVNKQESDERYFVVKNHEEQYSIWPYYKPIPNGWKAIGEPRKKEDCLSFIDETWKDMRPLSLRREMEESADKQR